MRVSQISTKLSQQIACPQRHIDWWGVPVAARHARTAHTDLADIANTRRLVPVEVTYLNMHAVQWSAAARQFDHTARSTDSAGHIPVELLLG
jgi:hypothetical protein